MTEPASEIAEPLEEQSAPVIKLLKIERFRGIQSLSWQPELGINVILGGGDTGKTTILEAIAILLAPTNSTTLSDSDYWNREVPAEFTIEAVMSLPGSAGMNQQSAMAWPWAWNGKEAVVPDAEAESNPEPVYRLRVRGTSDLELVHEVVQPDESVNSFSVGLRRAIGLVRLSGDDRNDRDLRLVYGSALERLLSDKGLRGRLGKELAKNTVEGHLEAEARTTLTQLDSIFKKKQLPSQLGLGLTGSPGLSVNALVGLTANKAGVALPLMTWGAGTRRLASLAIATMQQSLHPITLVDEIERGLEPYRQRTLMKSLLDGGSQVFITTHSAAVVSSLSNSVLWYLDARCAIGRLPNERISQQLKRDPEAFLAKLTIVGEGITEVGFASALLEKALPSPPVEHGVWVTDGGGHDCTLDLLEALASGGMEFGGVVDNESRFPERWKKVQEKLSDLLLRWKDGSLEATIVSLVEDDKLEELIKDPADELTGERLRTLQERLNASEKDFASIKAAAGRELKSFIIAAAIGGVPDDKKSEEKAVRKRYEGHAAKWFKSEEGGRELAGKVFCLGVWPKLESQVLPFLNAVRGTVGLERISSLPHE
jgi:putative ATP-dependent endonuclease of the OLD family